jgi:staphylococcal nuclease domain-containing protein 1
MMEDEAKKKLKAAELQAKKERLRMWTNYQPPASNSKPIHDQNFTGKVHPNFCPSINYILL